MRSSGHNKASWFLQAQKPRLFAAPLNSDVRRQRDMIRKSTALFLMLTAVVLLIYPLWGVIAPDSYANAELKHHYAYDSETTETQVVAASWSLYLSNSVLALSLASFA